MFIVSCAPVNNFSLDNILIKNPSTEKKQVLLNNDDSKESNYEKKTIF